MEVAVSIGNTDNKLTQGQWAEYVERVGDVLWRYETTRYFFGGSENWARWQNVMWLCVVKDEDIDTLKQKLTHIRKDYRQESLYILMGDGEMI